MWPHFQRDSSEPNQIPSPMVTLTVTPVAYGGTAEKLGWDWFGTGLGLRQHFVEPLQNQDGTCLELQPVYVHVSASK